VGWAFMLSPQARPSLLRAAKIFTFECLRKRRSAMFTGIVECYVKSGRKEDFREKMKTLVLPVLQSEPGFIDLLALSSEDEPDRMLSISLWESQADAERFHRRHYEEILDSVLPLLQGEPSIEFYRVDASTAHRIAVGQAA
jgi:quinol monooxygenase YgiN